MNDLRNPGVSIVNRECLTSPWVHGSWTPPMAGSVFT